MRKPASDLNKAARQVGDTARQNPAQHRAPFAHALLEHAERDTLQIMVPGHGCDAERSYPELVDFLSPRGVALDVPPMTDGIDLGENTPLDEALELAAEAWGASRTWFMTNGASQANRTAAIAVRALGERVMVQRAMHSSFTDGILLAGLMPSFVVPNVDTHNGVTHGLTPEALDEALTSEAEAGRKVDSIYVVSPSYFGAVADVEGLAKVAHAHDAAIIVDGAWGPHFGFHPDLPGSPVALGADLVISSTHKLVGSLTQSAMLHLGHGPLAKKLEPFVERAYTMTGSTSASNILKGTLDVARHGLINGRDRIEDALRGAEELREALRQDDRFRVLSDDFGDFDDIHEIDTLRIPVDVSRLGHTGHWVRQRLIADHDIYCEMSTATTIVIIFGALATPAVERTLEALRAVADAAQNPVDEDAADIPVASGNSVVVATDAWEATTPGHAVEALSAEGERFPEIPKAGTMRLLPRDAYFADAFDVVAAEDAVGRISADTLAAYPPGIPNVLPGEEITEEIVKFLQAVATSPTGYVRGAQDAKVTTFRVVAE
ncbi:aminotransferase class I/II-fold pyridoxal phosphate-dependent enzyme [Pseudoglutamicibacter cumminsii]|uniref:aminotransferase class I/II-fold pyridoxal phosphate-dependent enzyme n=1 Tax=Pseudoglutamicibacter cumminsii TaxID=156979 RepID=UPI00195EED35|nr:aminotransferase class I/II-fold pyridoxal phosphate-dependent enzyme [Pseudoglutamicibacter cumminsii]MBM7795988.1 arginine/lysine/ornithine decarboxylase [Pseudoglutamicibacter cumminsii]